MERESAVDGVQEERRAQGHVPSQSAFQGLFVPQNQARRGSQSKSMHQSLGSSTQYGLLVGNMRMQTII
jgi:hypothetical protein